MELFEYDFMRRAFMAGILVGFLAPVIGTFLVLRRYTRLADTLAHVSLAGVAFGLLSGLNPVASAVVVSVGMAVGIEGLRSRSRIVSESALALFLWGGLALAVVMISLAKGFNADLFSYLFGSIATVSTNDLKLISAVGGSVAIIMGLCYRQMFMVAYDEEIAKVGGVPAQVFNLLLVILAALAISISIRVVGILLIGALMVVPVMAAMQIARSFKGVLVYAVCISLASVIMGLITSYYFDLASGGTIVLIAIVFFIITLITGKE